MTVVYRKINGQWFYTPVELDSFDYYRDYLLVRNFGELINANVAEQGSAEAGLFGHWKLDSKDGDTLVDEIGSGDFTLYSGDMADISIISGHDGNAIRNSSSDIVLYASSSSPYSIFTTNFSVIKWIYSTVVPVPTGLYSFLQVDDPDYSGFRLSCSGYPSVYDLQVMMNMKTDIGWMYCYANLPLGASAFTVDTWHMITVTVDMNDEDPIKYYLNDTDVGLMGDTLYGSGSAVSYPSGEHKPNLRFINTVGTEYLDMDDFRFYSITLTPEQISDLYNS